MRQDPPVADFRLESPGSAGRRQHSSVMAADEGGSVEEGPVWVWWTA